MVVRVGDGATALSGSSAPVFVERRYLDNVGDIVSEAGNTIALPTAASGANQPLTLSNTTRDGLLSLSADGRYATMLGYGAAPGVSGLSSSANPPISRIVARIDSSNAVDTSTVLTPGLSAGNSRTATSVDGSAFWVGGSGAAGGVHHISFGTTGGTRVLASPSSVRSVAVFGGQLYGASGDTPFSGIFTIGTGLPTTTDQTATQLPGLPTMGQSPLSFVLLGVSRVVADLDTLYVADERAPGMGGGIQKWTFDGATWTLVTTFNLDNTGTALTVGMRGLAGVVIGNAVTLVAVSATGSSAPNGIFIYRDDGSSMNPTPTLLSTSATNTVYRGVALAP